MNIMSTYSQPQYGQFDMRICRILRIDDSPVGGMVIYKTIRIDILDKNVDNNTRYIIS